MLNANKMAPLTAINMEAKKMAGAWCADLAAGMTEKKKKKRNRSRLLKRLPRRPESKTPEKKTI